MQIVPDDITNSISVLVVGASLYYAVKLVRLSREFEFVALKGGKAPYYIVIGIAFLAVDRILDLLANFFAREFGNQVALTLNDPPAALAGVFILLGLREMYVVYRREAAEAKKVAQPREIWHTERTDRTA